MNVSKRVHRTDQSSFYAAPDSSLSIISCARSGEARGHTQDPQARDIQIRSVRYARPLRISKVYKMITLPSLSGRLDQLLRLSIWLLFVGGIKCDTTSYLQYRSLSSSFHFCFMMLLGNPSALTHQYQFET